MSSKSNPALKSHVMHRHNDPESSGSVIHVLSSTRPVMYTIALSRLSDPTNPSSPRTPNRCSCPGFAIRQSCTHIAPASLLSQSNAIPSSILLSPYPSLACFDYPSHRVIPLKP